VLEPSDDVVGAPRVVMISHPVWMREYGGDPSILGRDIRIHGQPYTIVGVAAREFTGMVPMLQPEMWIPTAWIEEVEPAGIQDAVPSPTGKTRLERRGQRWMFVKARLKDGENAQSAEANLHVIMQQLASTHPKTNEKRPISVLANVRLHPQADRALRPVAAGLMLGVGLVLLVACANVTNMLLARASARQREIGIRLAIGASRARLIRQLLTESVVLSVLGAAAGIGLAALLLELFAAVPAPVPVPLELALQIDSRVLLFTLGIATLAGLIAGLAPALRATRPNLAAEMKGDTPPVSTVGRHWTLRDGLVAAQTAITLVLLVAAGLLTRSIIEARRIDLGFRPGGIAALAVDVGLIGYDETRAKQLYERATERIRTIPGTVAAARAQRQPLRHLLPRPHEAW
jgi:predicted permease